MSSNNIRLPTYTPRTTHSWLKHSRKVGYYSVDGPPKKPIMLMQPLILMALKDCAMLCGPPTSTTWFTPRESGLRRAATVPQSDSALYLMIWSAPRLLIISAFDSEPVVAMTRAPAALANWRSRKSIINDDIMTALEGVGNQEQRLSKTAFVRSNIKPCWAGMPLKADRSIEDCHACNAMRQ